MIILFVLIMTRVRGRQALSYYYYWNMEACVLVEREQDKIIKKLRVLSGSAAKKLQQLIDQVSELKAKFEEGCVFDSY